MNLFGKYISKWWYGESWFVVISKCFVTLLLFDVIFFTVKLTIENIIDDRQYGVDSKKQINLCNDSYYDEDYNELWEHLRLYDLYSEDYEVYWEMTQGYRDYQTYQVYKNAKEGNVSGCDALCETYRKKVFANARDCQYKENQSRLEVYCTQLQEE